MMIIIRVAELDGELKSMNDHTRTLVAMTIGLMLFSPLEFTALGQEDTPPPDAAAATNMDEQAPSDTESTSTAPQGASPAIDLANVTREFVYAVIILAGGILVSLVILLAYVIKPDKIPVLQCLGMTSIVWGVLFLVVVELKLEQFAILIGLFGALIGFLLGKKWEA